jgi:hypothetical protein
MFINNSEENILSQVSFLPFAKILNGDGPRGREIDVWLFLSS